MHLATQVALCCAIYLCYRVYKKSRRISVSHIPGPKPESYILGNLRQSIHGHAAEADIKWSEEYGGVVRIKAPLGEDRLLISDPKALQYIHTSGYSFHKQAERIELSRMIAGRGILWADGEVHRRHRRVMQPAFTIKQSKSFFPLFQHIAHRLSERWRSIIAISADNEETEIDVHRWLSRATLDTIGEAAFDYHFQMLNDDSVETPLAKAYSDMMSSAFGSPSQLGIFVQSISQHIPTWLLNVLSDKMMPSQRLERLRMNANIVHDIGKELVDRKIQAAQEGKGGKDVMSLLIKANASEKADARLNEEEMLAQIRTLMFAGHDTTSNTISWCLYELARHPSVQSTLRREIREVKMRAIERGDSNLTVIDLEGMVYTMAVIKETLRFHPVVVNTYRQAAHDDILPLSKPIVTISGEVINELRVPKGMKITISIAAYNRNRDIFGQDVHSFRPGRWLDGSVKEGSGGGVFTNLLSFAGGVRSCIGWRFAVLELQAFIIELISNFEFSLRSDIQIMRSVFIIMAPSVDGKRDKRAQLPLMVGLVEEN